MQAGTPPDVGRPGCERLDSSSGESTAGQPEESQPEAAKSAEASKDASQRQAASLKGCTAKPPPTACPRCQSPNTKFAYWNNYNSQQPRFFCKVRMGLAWLARCKAGPGAGSARTECAGAAGSRRFGGCECPGPALVIYPWPKACRHFLLSDDHPRPQPRRPAGGAGPGTGCGLLRAGPRAENFWSGHRCPPHTPNARPALLQACQRYWTAGGTLRNVPVGAGRRKNSKSGREAAEPARSLGLPGGAAGAAGVLPAAALPLGTACPALVPDGALLGMFGPAPGGLAPAGARAGGGAAPPLDAPAEGGRRVRARLEPAAEAGAPRWPGGADAGAAPGFGEWASLAAQQQLQQQAALQAAALGQAHAQLLGGGWGGGGPAYLPLWPYNLYGGAPNWAAAYARCRPEPPERAQLGPLSPA